MTKIVLKKSEVLKSARALVIQPLENKSVVVNDDASQKTVATPKPSTEELLRTLNEEHTAPPADTQHQEDIAEQKALAEQNSRALLQEAQSQADQILTQAKKDANEIRSEAQKQKDDVLTKAQSEAEEVRRQIEKERQDTKTQATQEGMEEGYQKAEEETKRLVTLLQKISIQMVDEKTKILNSVESDIVELILMISSKVVKSITSQYKQVVYDNVVAAIEKIKIRNDLTIKVNPEDLYTMEQHKSDLLKEINGIENIQFLEDPTIEQGGCIVKADFGSIDGRISSQLAEIEEQIRKISPIKPL